MTKKRKLLEREIRKIIAIIRKERPQCCEACGDRGKTDPSHNYSKKHFPSLAAKKWNITLLRRDKHRDWEDNKLWKVSCSYRLIADMWSKALLEEDLDRAKRMKAHVVNKLFKCADHGEEGVVFSKSFEWMVNE